MKRSLTILFASAFMVSLTSCATIFSGTRQTVRIESEPSGAKIEVNGIDYGVTPATIAVNKNLNTPNILLRKEGYQTKSFIPESTFDAVSVLNIFFPLGFVVDAVTGAIKKYSPANYNISLEPETSASNR